MFKTFTAASMGALLLVGATTATAATVSRSGSTITYTAGAGEENRLDIQGSSSGKISFYERASATAGGLPPYSITAGPGCTGHRPGETVSAQCEGEGVTLVVVRLGDMKDELSRDNDPQTLELPSGVKLKADGGSGNDRLLGTAASDTLIGGSGDDTLYGGGGKDVEDGGRGNDGLTGFGTLRGGPGNDRFTLLYLSGGFKVFATKAYGGAGNDSFISGNKKRDTLDCGKGSKDVVYWGKYKGEDKLKSCEQHVP